MRTATDGLATGLAVLSTVLVVAPLVAIFVYLIYKGASSLSLAFFTQVPKPEGETGGGMANAIVGSAVLLGLASLIGVPIGISGGIFLAEFGRGTKLANAVRFTADVLNGVPSIVMGIAVYSLIVYQQKHFSAFSGGVALGIMMIPTVTRTTEEMLLMVPHAVREAALAEGLLADLEKHRALCMDTSLGAFVFPSERGTALSKDNVWRRNMQPALAKVGLGWANFQVMRRTHGTLMRQLKEDPHAVAAQLGHTVDVSLNVYAQSPVEGRRDMVNRLEKLVIK